MHRLAPILPLVFVPVMMWAQEEPISQQEVAIFARYHVGEVFRGSPAPLDLHDPDARMYRTRLRDAAKHGANFAGHYAMATWGCGSGCVQFAAINLTNGHVTFFPAGLSWSLERDSGVRFRPDSRAVHAVGALNEKDSADRWYEWTGERFKLIAKKPAELEPDEPDADN